MTVVDGLLADRYRLGPRIATGGMGEVWRAKDVVLDRDVAVKTLRAEFTDDEDFRIRFRAEARHAARLSHPGIASVYDFGESAERAWLVMELVEGEPLSALLHREGALSPERTLEVIAQTAAALQVAHDGGVVHRDVKPGNLMLRPDGVVKVTDFGIASAVDAAPVTRTGEVVGTGRRPGRLLLGGVQVSAEQWLGQPAAVARDGLAAQGLVPRLIEDGAGRPVGTVSGVDPVGDLAAGTTVVLHVVPAPPPEPVRQPEGDRREAPKGENRDDDKKGGKRR